MTLAVCSRLDPPSVEFNITPGLESDLVDAVHAVIAPEVPLGRIVVHVRHARDSQHGLIQMTLMQSEEDREGLRLFTAQIVSSGTGTGKVFVTRMAVPEELQGQGRARAMARGLFEATARYGALMVLCDLDQVAVARLVRRGAHRLAPDAVQLLASTQLD